MEVVCDSWDGCRDDARIKSDEEHRKCCGAQDEEELRCGGVRNGFFIVLYLLFRDGLLPADLQKLLAHAQLPAQHSQIISNLELIGARTSRNLKDSRPPPQPLFPPKPQPIQTPGAEEVLLSGYEPVLQSLLEAHADGKVDHNAYPYTKPPLDLGQEQSHVSALQA